MDQELVADHKISPSGFPDANNFIKLRPSADTGMALIDDR
jgi:hypothetical protein